MADLSGRENCDSYADLTRYIMAHKVEEPKEEPEPKPPTPVQLLREKRRLLKDMKRMVKNINAIEVRDHIDADDLAEYLYTIRKSLGESIEQLEALG